MLADALPVQARWTPASISPGRPGTGAQSDGDLGRRRLRMPGRRVARFDQDQRHAALNTGQVLYLERRHRRAVTLIGTNPNGSFQCQRLG
jgi:hypothetical protein